MRAWRNIDDTQKLIQEELLELEDAKILDTIIRLFREGELVAALALDAELDPLFNEHCPNKPADKKRSTSARVGR